MARKTGIFRSGFENSVFESSLKGTNSEYECLKIPYIRTTKHIYTPDFLLPNGIIVEVKGRLTAFDRAKHLLVRAQHPDLDIRFVFAYDNKLYKTSNTRYSDWCDDHEFKYAFKGVPEEWLGEQKRKVVLDADIAKKFKMIWNIMNSLIVETAENVQALVKKLT